MKTLMMAALAALFCSAAFAQDSGPRPATASKAQSSDHPAFAWRGYGSGQDAPYRAFGAVNPREGLSSAAREPALRECAETSRKFTESTWGHMQMHQWRTCMAARGQPE
jgi:hypothetical protein